MRTHPYISPVGIDAIGNSVAVIPSPIGMLSADAVAELIPVNTNHNWACGKGKRVLDLFVAIPLLVLLAPLFAAIAVLVRLDSKGPALFRQARSGICGRRFHILKFRTMTVMEDGAEVVQACEGDPRTTRMGRILRRYSLDELPQLLNIVVGDMSLVGPRPHALAHDDHFGELIAQYRHRFAAKPGMTGWAQVHGHRGPTPTVAVMAARIDHDVWYVKNASLALDLKILLRTPLEVFRPRNAC